MRFRDKVKSVVMPSILRRIKPHWPEAAFISKFLSEERVDCVLDVGANVGQYGWELRSTGYRGLILSFEPDPVAYERLKFTAKGDPSWKTLNLALGESRGTMALNIMASSSFNSFRTPELLVDERIASANTIVAKKQVTVETLAHILTRLQNDYVFSHPFLKMDTQGFDLEVFRGAKPVLETIVGLQSEVPVKSIYQGAPGLSEMLGEYLGAGLQLKGIYPVNPHDDEILEVDCIFSNPHRASLGRQ